MAIVRRIDPDWNSGYGVIGQIYQNDTLSREVDILTILSNEIQPVQVNVPGGTGKQDSEVNFCNVVWRAKFQVLTADLTLADTFNTQAEKRKFGRYLFKAEDYVTHEEFLSYALHMSALGGFVYGHGSVQSKDDVPCDEPPIEIASPTIIQSPAAGNAALFAPYSGIQIPGVSQGIVTRSSTIPADKVLFIPETCIQSYIIGITFMFVQRALTLQQYIQQGLPPVILL